MKFKLFRIMTAIATMSLQNVIFSGSAIADTGLAFKDTFGSVYLYGLQPNAVVRVNLGAKVTRIRTANSCGFLKMSSSLGTDLQLPTNKGTTAHFTLASLPTISNPPQCRRGHLYLPENWSWPTVASTSSGSTGGSSSTSGGGTSSTGGSTSGTGVTVPSGYSPVTLNGVSKVGTAVVVAGLTPGGTYKLQLLAGSLPVYNGSLPTPDACGLSQVSVAALGSGNATYKISNSSNGIIFQGSTSTIPTLPYHSVACFNGQVMQR